MENNILSKCDVCFNEQITNYIITECNHSICISCFASIFYNSKKYSCVVCRKMIYKKDFTDLIKPIKYDITHDYDNFKVNIITNHIKFHCVKLYFYVKLKHKEFFTSNQRRIEMIYNRIQEEIEKYVKNIIENWNYEIKNINNFINDDESNDTDESDEENNLKIIFDKTQKSNSNEIFIYNTNSNYNDFTLIVD